MRSKIAPSGQPKPSFIEEARRRQIVETAIQIIAERGLSAASLAEIAREAGCSKGVISYHFDGKDALIEEILSRLIREPAEFIKQRVDACTEATSKLRAYIDSNFEFMRTHRNHYVALVDLWGSRGWSEGRNRFNAEAYEPSRAYLSNILDSGQQCGEFGSRPSKTMASVIQGSIDGVMLQWVCDPEDIDLMAAGDQIMEMILTHVGRGKGSGKGRQS